MTTMRSPMKANFCVMAAILTALGGCASLPTNGPTAGQVERGLRPDNNLIGMRMVDVNEEIVSKEAAATAAADARIPTLASLQRVSRNDVLGPGDVLDISVFEVGATLFGSARGLAETYDPSAQPQKFPPVMIDRNGKISLPYAGVLSVAGHTAQEVQEMIVQAYHGKSQNPQALVVVQNNISQTAYVTGDVRKPGRIELTLQNERLLDAIATAGGTVNQSQDMVVRFARGGQRIEERLDRIQAGAPDDLILEAGDRIELIREPQTFIMFGAANRVSQVSFDQTDLTVAEAIARGGGPNDALANPKSVFLLRYEPPVEVGGPRVPTIYRLDMMNPSDYFLAQRFAMRNKDVVYVSNAAINRTAKFAAIINQLFSPFLAARAVAGN